MNNVTSQLFEYLLAAQKSNKTACYDLNKYQGYWYLDKILSYDNVVFDHAENKNSIIKIKPPVMQDRKNEISILLYTVLNLMHYNNTKKNPTLISKSELKKNLLLEMDAISRKIDGKETDAILVNDWQQLLLGVNQAYIPMTLVKTRIEKVEAVVKKIVSEYSFWKNNLKLQQLEKENLQEQKALYDYFVSLNTENSNLELKFGLGILEIPRTNRIYHPLLTTNLKINFDYSTNSCELHFENLELVLDKIIEYLFFHNQKQANELTVETNNKKINLFDESMINSTLKKLVKQIHPEGRYLDQFADDFKAESNPTVLNRAVLFIDEKASGQSNKLENAALYLKDGKSSDVIGSIVNPAHEANPNAGSSYAITNPLELIYPGAAIGIEEDILNLLDDHNAITVATDDLNDESEIVSNLAMHFLATGKKLLVLSENEEKLDSIRRFLPKSLNGLHSKFPSDAEKTQAIKGILKDLDALKKKINEKDAAGVDSLDIHIEIKEIEDQKNEIIQKMVEYRELGCKKVFWKDKRYFPFELAQLVTKLGGKDYLKGDIIPITSRFDMKESEIEKMWSLRPYFIPENLSLLQYDFININDLYNYHEYQKMLTLEEKYHELSKKGDFLETMFDKSTDIRFVQYLFDQLPKLINDITQITSDYGMKILKMALSNIENYHSLIANLDRINRGIKEFETDGVNNESKDALISKMNLLFQITNSELAVMTASNNIQVQDFYKKKRVEMSQALRTAHLILVFNERATSLSGTFKGIKADGLDMMSVLYDASSLHLSKIEFEICWYRVKSHFIRYFQSTIEQVNIHPVCVDLYEALKRNQINEFREVLEELENLVKIRQNFITFGDFIKSFSDIIPTFTASIMSTFENDESLVPSFIEAIDKGKLNGLFKELETYESLWLEAGLEYLTNYQLELQVKLVEVESLKKSLLADEESILKLANQLETGNFDLNGIAENLPKIFSTVFLHVASESPFNDFDPQLFDVAIYLDANCSNVFKITELMHANKAILFGNPAGAAAEQIIIDESDFAKLSESYGDVFSKFGEYYFTTSLFNLVADSAAFESQLKLKRQMSSMAIQKAIENTHSGIRVCESTVENEIFDSLMKIGYDIKCKVKVHRAIVDFLVSGESNVMAINVVGDSPMQKDAIKMAIEKEMELIKRGIRVYTVHATDFYLNSRLALTEINNELEKMEIYPLKKQGSEKHGV